MLNKISKIFAAASSDVKRRLASILILLILFNAAVWLMILIFSQFYPLLLGLATLSYGFGLKHAVDADHIAAIDNTTRKLVRDGQKPVTVGLFFSLGHSLIVIILSAVVAVSANFVQNKLPAFQEIGSVISILVSSLFLLVIGIINLVSLVETVAVWRSVVKNKKSPSDQTLEEFLNNKGIITKILRPLLKVVNHSFQMFLIGFLFGLGFDTATEIGLLSLSAVTAVQGIPFWAIIILPIAFTVGMTSVDTLDGILMLGAYGWAYVKPVRKLYYNMNITLISAITAIFIGGTQLLQFISHKTYLDFNNLGYFIVGAFMLSWIISIAVYQANKYN